jgi:hypothetical protein
LLYWPIAQLPYLAALAAWIAVGAAAYLGTIRGIVRGRVAMLAAASFPAVCVAALHGHNSLLLVGVMGAALTLLPRSPVAAGLLLSVMTVKPHLALLIPVALAAGRQWRALGGAAAGAIALGGITTLAFGARIWPAFLGSIPLARRVLETGGIPYYKYSSVFAGARLLGADPGLAYACQAGAALIAAALVARLWWRRASHDVACAAAVLGTLIATPYLFDYDLALCALPIAWLARRAKQAGALPWESSVLAACWLVPLVARPVAQVIDLTLAPVLLAAALAIAVARARSAEVPALPSASRP